MLGDGLDGLRPLRLLWLLEHLRCQKAFYLVVDDVADVSVDVEKVWCIYVKTLEVSEANKLPSLSTWEARRLPLIPHIPHFNFHSKCISLIIKTYLSILRNSFGLRMPSGFAWYFAIIYCTWDFVWVHLFKCQFSSCVFLREIHQMYITGWFSLFGLPCSVLIWKILSDMEVTARGIHCLHCLYCLNSFTMLKQ